MSGGVSNLGMGLSGFAPARQASEVVNSALTGDDYAQWLQGWQSRLNAASAPSYASPFDQAVQDNAAILGMYNVRNNGAFSGNEVQQVQQAYGGAGDPNLQALLAPYLGTGGANQLQTASRDPVAAYDNAAIAKIQAEKTQQEALQQNAPLQQQAYNQQTGGGFTGGLLNGSYSQPFGNVLGGNPSAPQGFSGGMMGSGQAPAASTGLNPWVAPATGSSPSSANSGAWGGPFSAKNPWSLS